VELIIDSCVRTLCSKPEWTDAEHLAFAHSKEWISQQLHVAAEKVAQEQQGQLTN
jgi:hypothetical protein